MQDHPGAGGTSDTIGLLAALMRHKARGAVIGMLVDEEAARAAVATGEGNIMHRGIGAVVGYAGEKPVVADWRGVKGHAGDPGNEKADELANRGVAEAMGR